MQDQTLIARLNFSSTDRFTHTLALNDETGDLFVSTGVFDTDECAATVDDRVGSVRRVGGDAPLEGGELFVQRARNPMFLECHKADCFAMDLADAAAERLVEIKKNVNLGYPCCKGKGGSLNWIENWRLVLFVCFFF